QLGGIVWPQFREEEICDGAYIPQQTDPLVDQWSDGAQFLGRRIGKSGLARVRHQSLREFIEIKSAQVLRIQPYGLGVEWIFRREVDGRITAVDSFERE